MIAVHVQYPVFLASQLLDQRRQVTIIFNLLNTYCDLFRWLIRLRRTTSISDTTWIIRARVVSWSILFRKGCSLFLLFEDLLVFDLDLGRNFLLLRIQCLIENKEEKTYLGVKFALRDLRLYFVHRILQYLLWYHYHLCLFLPSFYRCC